MATATTKTTDVSILLAYLPTTQNEVVRVIVLGLVVGALIPFLSVLIANYFITPVFCQQGGDFGVCASGGVIANHIAAVLVGFGAFAVLSHWAVYRALLLTLAATIALWGFKKYADPLTTGGVIEYYLFSALLYALAYALFYWILRLRNFMAALLFMIAAVIATCWAWLT